MSWPVSAGWFLPDNIKDLANTLTEQGEHDDD